MHRHPLRFSLFPYTTLFRSRRQLVQPPQRGGGRLLARVRFFQPLRLARVADAEPADERLEREALDQQRHRSEEHTSELQSHSDLVCRLLLEKKKQQINIIIS